MARTRKTIQPLNLYQYEVLIEDRATRSDYFKVTQFDGYLYGGRNAFLIAGDSVLKPNTNILIEVLDSEGNTVYSAPVANYIEGSSRLIKLEVYQDTPIGVGQVVILGCAETYLDGTPIPPEWRNKYNVRWTSDVVISPQLENKSPIRFENLPSMTVEEKFYFIPSSSAFEKENSQSVDIELYPKYYNTFHNGYTIRIKGPGNTTKYLTKYLGGVLSGSFAFTTETGPETASINLPITRIFNSGLAESDGALIYTDKDRLITSGIISSSGTYTTLIQPLGEIGVTSSVNLLYNELVTENTGSTISFAEVRLVDLETVSGEVNKIRVGYKVATDPGDYKLLGEVDVAVSELLAIDSGSKIVETGYFNDIVIDDYWASATMSVQQTDIYPTPPDYYTTSSLAPSGNVKQSSVFLLDSVNGTPELQDGVFKDGVSYFIGTRKANPITLFPRSEYTVSFKALVTKQSSSISLTQSDYSLEVYLVEESGSSGKLLDTNKMGQLIGRLTPTDTFLSQNFDTVEMNFVPKINQSGDFGIRFVVYGGFWNIADTSVKTSVEPLFSPDEVNILLPNTTYTNKLLTFKANYLDINNNSISVSTLSLPTYFTGSEQSVSVSVTSSAAISSSYALTASYAMNGGGTSDPFPYTGSAIITGSLQVTGSVTISGSSTLTNIGPTILSGGLWVTEGITGSLYGTSSWAESSSRTLDGVVTASAVNTTITFTKGDGSQFSVTVAQSGSVESSSYAQTAATASSVEYDNILNKPTLISSSNQISVISGSLYGTASWAVNAVSSSYTQLALSSSNAITASYAQTTNNAISASWASSSISASRATIGERIEVLGGGSTSGNGIYSGSLFGTASWATTASYALNAAGTGFPFSGSAVITGSLLISGSGLYLSGSGVTGSLLGTASWASTASNAISSSRALSASRADTVEKVDVLGGGSTSGLGIYSGSFYGTASQAVTASYALNAAGTGFPFSGSALITGSLLVSGSGVTVTGSLNVTQGISGSLFGTSSWAQSSSNSVSASRALSASRADSAATVDVLAGGSTSGTGIYSGSFYGTASQAITASYALNAAGTGFPFSGSALITGSLLVSGSGVTITGSLNVTGGTTSSLFGTASWAQSSSTSISASRALSTSRADSVEKIDVLSGGSTSGLGIYSGSFYGTASQAVTASYALNAGNGSGFPFSGSALITGSLLISGSGLVVTGSTTVTGGVTASVFGTASWAQSSSVSVSSSRALSASRADSTEKIDVLAGGSTSGNGIYSGSLFGTASWATTASYALNAGSSGFPFSGSALITGSLLVSGSGLIVSGSTTITNGITGSLFGTSSWASSAITASYFSGSISFPAGLRVTGSLEVSGSITGSLLGTSSWASNAISSSYAVSSSRTISASRADSTEKVDVINGGSTTALGVYSGSFFGTSSQAVTASYALNASGTGFPFSGSALITGSLVVSGSGLIVSGSTTVTNGVTGSLFGTSSWAQTASYAVTSSYVLPRGLPAGTISSSLQFNSLTTPFTGSYTGSLTGALTGTGSWAVSASTSISSSRATTASFVLPSGLPAGTVSSSLQFNSLTTPFTGSYTGSLTGTLTGTASFATSASYALSSSRALSASRADSTEKVDVLSGGSTTALGVYSGSFSGSFIGGGSFGGQALTLGSGLTGTSYNGSVAVTTTVDTGSTHFSGGVVKSLPAGTVSASSQVSYGSISGVPSGIISSSTQQVVATYTGGTDNRVLTSTGTSGINGEANLTYDGSTLTVNTGRPTTIGSDGMLYTKGDTGGWAFGHHARGSGSTDRGGFGWLGSSDDLSYYYIGPVYNSAAMYIFSASNYASVGIGTSGLTYSAVNRGTLEVNGTTDSIIALKFGNSPAGYILGDTSGVNIVSVTRPMILTATDLNPISMVTSGSTRMYISSSGKIGIGTTTPSSLLDVYPISDLGSGKNGIRVYRPGEATVYGYMESVASSDVTMFGSRYPGAYGKFYFRQEDGTNVRDALIINETGQLGLSVTPHAHGTYKFLQVQSYSVFGQQVGGTSQLVLGWNIRGSTNANEYLYNYTGDVATMYTQNSNGVHRWFSAGTGTAGNVISFTETMTLGDTGNLGISTNTLSEKLTVAGNIQLTTGANRYIQIGSVTNYYWRIQAVSDDLQFIDGPSSTRVTFQYNTGNVGIGTTSPDTNLSIVRGSGGQLPSSGTTPTNAALRIKASANNAMFMGIDTSSPYSGWLQVADITGLGTTYPIVLNPNGGNVGIGTTNPVAKLHVQGAVSSSGIVYATDFVLT